MDQKITVRTIEEYFGYRQITGDDRSLDRPVLSAEINRPGLELSGYYEHSDTKRTVLMGDKELAYIEGQMDEERQRKAFDFLTGEKTPMILISRDHQCPPLLKETAERKNFPIFTSFAPTGALFVELESYLEEQLAASISLHGELLIIYGIGTLIRGASGIGKSEIALELLKKGHILVADDRVDVARIHNHLVGECPQLIRDYLEIRGIGIINVTQMFGITATAKKAQIDLIIDLQEWSQNVDFDRIGNEEDEMEEICGVKVKKITLPVREGRSMAAIVESAVTNHLLLAKGINSPEEFEKRVQNYIKATQECGR